MGYFIIGDVHGCYHTLLRLLAQWERVTEQLVFVGDLIDKGNFSARVMQYCRELVASGQAHVLKGNHEYELALYAQQGHHEVWLRKGGRETIAAMEQAGMSLQDWAGWCRQLPLRYETDHLLVTHAGIAAAGQPYDEAAACSVLRNRGPLLALDKLQVHGHTPLKGSAAVFRPEFNAWNIDTAAAYGYGLSGLRIDDAGQVSDLCFMPTEAADIAPEPVHRQPH